MDEQTREKIMKWVFDNHSHHIDRKSKGCVDQGYPYVNSRELEQFINTLALSSGIKSAIPRIEIINETTERNFNSFKSIVYDRCKKFINKVETGRARSKETYADMKYIVNFFDQMENAMNVPEKKENEK